MPTYVTAQEVIDATTNAALKEEATGTIESLIETAENHIDAEAGYWERYDPYQERIFPRSIDLNSSGATFIHSRVKSATIAQVEFLYLETPDVEHGIMEDDPQKKRTMLSPRAKFLMRGLTRRSGKIVFPEQTRVRSNVETI